MSDKKKLFFSFQGAFGPPTYGHYQSMETFITKVKADYPAHDYSFLFMPTARSGSKLHLEPTQRNRIDILEEFSSRLKTEHEVRVEASTIEYGIYKDSNVTDTIYTINKIKEVNPEAVIVLGMGQDNVLRLPFWKDIREYNKEVNKANPRNYTPRMPKEFYLENYNAGFWNFENNKWSYGCTKVDLSKMCGHSVLLIGKDLYHYGIKKHREDIPSGLDLLGKKFDLLRPVLLIKIDESKIGYNRYIWKCECDCGETCTKSTLSLTNRSNIKIKNSCGCENKKSARWKKLDISSKHFSRIKSGAKNRKLDFDLTPEFLHELYQKQKKKSAISGRKLVMPEYVGKGTGLSQCVSDNKDLIASLDRIDSKKGYIKTNVWWISRRENSCKMDLSIDDMQQFFMDGYAYLKESKRIQKDIEAGRFS